MSEINSIIETQSKNGKKYMKVEADGKTYSAWPDSKAFEQLDNNEFKVGDRVKLNYVSKTSGNITYKNLTDLEKLSVEEAKQEASKPSESSNGYWKQKFRLDEERFMADLARQRSITMSGAINSAIEFFKMNEKRIPGKEIVTQESVVGVAEYFYDRIRRKMKEEN